MLFLKFAHHFQDGIVFSSSSGFGVFADLVADFFAKPVRFHGCFLGCLPSVLLAFLAGALRRWYVLLASAP